MPLKEVIDEGDEDSPIEEMFHAFVGPIRNAATAHVVRVVRGRPKDRLIRAIDVSVGESEDASELALALAKKLFAYAERDAGDKTQKYRASLLSKPGTDRKPVVLASADFVIGDEESTDPGRVATSHAQAMSDKTIKLLDHTANLFARLVPIAQVAGEHDKAVSVADAQARVEIERIRSEDRRDLRDEKASEFMVGFFKELLDKPIIVAATFYLSERAMEMRDARLKREKERKA